MEPNPDSSNCMDTEPDTIKPDPHHWKTVNSLSTISLAIRTILVSRMSSPVSPPEAVRGMTELDNAVFVKRATLPCLHIKARVMRSIILLVTPYYLLATRKGYQ